IAAEAAPGEASRSPSTEPVPSTTLRTMPELGEGLRTFGEAEWACRRLRELSMPLVIGRFSLSRGGSSRSSPEPFDGACPFDYAQDEA
ncbi:MAG: hypothetical protein V3S81_07295, partial [Anaerolineales bacterium]